MVKAVVVVVVSNKSSKNGGYSYDLLAKAYDLFAKTYDLFAIPYDLFTEALEYGSPGGTFLLITYHL